MTLNQIEAIERKAQEVSLEAAKKVLPPVEQQPGMTQEQWEDTLNMIADDLCQGYMLAMKEVRKELGIIIV